MSITLTSKGDFSKTFSFLKRMKEKKFLSALEKYGEEGVKALQEATPKDTGLTAASWGYKIEKGEDSTTITWTNSNENNGVPIVILIQYGHATGTGGYVQGRDFINPAMRPIFDKIAQEAWMEVTKS